MVFMVQFWLLLAAEAVARCHLQCKKSLPQLVLLLIVPIEPQGSTTFAGLLAATEDWNVGSRDGALHPPHAVQRH